MGIFTVCRLAAAIVITVSAIWSGVPAPQHVQDQIMTDLGLNVTATHNTLMPAEANLGWQLMFDGQKIDKWHGQNSNIAPPGWSAVNGEMYTSGTGFQHAYSNEIFVDFVWTLEWKVPVNGNSGMFIRAQEDNGGRVHWHAAEMQIADNNIWYLPEEHQKAGGLYYVYWPTNGGENSDEPYFDPVKTTRGADGGDPDGYNRAIIIAYGQHIEYWLNGIKTVDIELGSQDYENRINGLGNFNGGPGNYTGLPSNWQNTEQFNT